MSNASRVVCNQCNGVIPSNAQYIGNVSAVLHLTSGQEAFPSCDFCCSDHLIAYIKAQAPVLPIPNPPLTPLP